MSKHLEAGGREMFTNGLNYLDHCPRNQSHIFLTLPPYAKNKSLNETGRYRLIFTFLVKKKAFKSIL